jgi:uncharacterized protein (DUF1499 family)
VSNRTAPSASSAAGRSSARARLSSCALALAVLAGIAAISSGFGWRLGLWYFRDGFKILEYSVYAAMAAGVLSLVALFWRHRAARRSGTLAALAGLVISLAIAGYPTYFRYIILPSKPYIHDITTDTENPPAFVAALPLRQGVENSATYGGPDVAKQQLAGYPDIKPAHFNAPPDRVFGAALALAIDSGWTVTAALPAEGRIEAFDTTLWYGFKDDIVLRIVADGAGTRVDMRSESRYGRSDFGVNARRITKYLAALQDRVAVQ